MHRFAMVWLLGTLSATPPAWAAAVDLYAKFGAYGQLSEFDGVTGTLVGPFAYVVNPQALTFGPDGNLYAGDVYTGSILRFDGVTGTSLGTFASGIGTSGLAFGPDGNLYVAGQYAGSVPGVYVGGILQFD